MRMKLSNEQMRAVEAGINNKANWEDIPLPSPVTQSDLPAWLRGIEIRWMEGYINPPSYTLVTTRNVHDWQKTSIWTYDAKEGLYSTQSEDGTRARFYYAGELFYDTEFKIFQGYGDDPKTGERSWNHPIYKEVPTWHTPQTEGLGGAHIQVIMDDGRKGFLWGAWVGMTPPGWMCGGSITQGGGGGGVIYFSEDVFLKAIAYYQPHLRVARVRRGSITELEVYKDGQAPKGFNK